MQNLRHYILSSWSVLTVACIFSKSKVKEMWLKILFAYFCTAESFLFKIQYKLFTSCIHQAFYTTFRKQTWTTIEGLTFIISTSFVLFPISVMCCYKVYIIPTIYSLPYVFTYLYDCHVSIPDINIYIHVHFILLQEYMYIYVYVNSCPWNEWQCSIHVHVISTNCYHLIIAPYQT